MFSFVKRHSGFFLLLAGIAGLVILNLSQTAAAEEAEVVSSLTTEGTATTAAASPTTAAFVFVDVRGEVYAPGVYRVPAGTRVVDVIAMAGGPTRNADLDALNQAKVVADEMVVFVPCLETAGGTAGSWIWVDVKGAVVSPGVYCLATGSRGIDATAAAGGLLDSADAGSVNLSALLSDATILYVPFAEETEIGGAVTAHIPGYGYVAVKGEVLHPGLYYVSTESTVEEVIALAGGPTLTGSVQNLDLDEVVIPGSTIEVLSERAVFALLQAALVTTTTTVPGSSATTTRHLVNINTATVEELDTLYGIGPVIAQNIIDYRAENGFFEKIEDLVNVSGIGQSVYEAIQDDITV